MEGAYIYILDQTMINLLRRLYNVRTKSDGLNETYDIETRFIEFQCFVTTDMTLHSKSIILEDSENPSGALITWQGECWNVDLKMAYKDPAQWTRSTQ